MSNPKTIHEAMAFGYDRACSELRKMADGLWDAGDKAGASRLHDLAREVESRRPKNLA